MQTPTTPKNTNLIWNPSVESGASVGSGTDARFVVFATVWVSLVVFVGAAVSAAVVVGSPQCSCLWYHV